MSLDFLTIQYRNVKGGGVEIYPDFTIYPKPKDLLIRGKDFYAVWNEDLGMWSTDEDVCLALIDKELNKYASESGFANYTVKYMRNASSGMVDAFHKFCQKQMRDSFRMLDEELVFLNTETKRENYSSKRLPYPLEPGTIKSYDQLISTLYSPEERHKIEWIIGSIVSGDSKELQKFAVLYGAAGTGKSTILNIIGKLFEGYTCTFDARSLGSASSQFSLEPFRNNPLVAIQHDGDLSRLEDNTRINSLVSHETMVINEKNKGQYENSFKCFLFMGTNKPVKITDAKSGLLRRLIDISPTGNKVPPKEYKKLIKQIDFELGAIAHHCLQVYEDDPYYYDDYVPTSMMDATNDFFNFVYDSYSVFKKDDSTTLKAAWEMYKNYVEDARISYPFSKRVFQEELKNYFKEYHKVYISEDGSKLQDCYRVFDYGRFEREVGGSKSKEKPVEQFIIPDWLIFDEQESVFDKECAEYPAQYATNNGTPMISWDKVKTKLSSLDTSRLHYVKVPEVHIVIDFDIKDENGEKSFEKNVREAAKWPATYAELSKSGGGIHLHYIYQGDPNMLSRIYDENIEIKVFAGGSSLRRKLTKCNKLAIAAISSGLPLKGVDTKMLSNFDGLKNEQAIRTLIKRHMNKEIMGKTVECVQMIYKVLEESYASGMTYDVTDMRNALYSFAMQSTNSADECSRLVDKMKFKSDDAGETISNEPVRVEDKREHADDDSPLVFFDIEVFPNLFLVCWKIAGEGKPVVRWFNPKPSDIEQLIRYKIVGFNNRDYDNHMIYACLMGYTNEQLYKLSQRLITSPKSEKLKHRFGEAYNLSYTDVYDFASASNKKSLKKLQIEMGIHHQELGYPWDQPLPEDKWEEAGDYCSNDVTSTEAAFHYLKGDWIARQILADISGLTVNDTTNSHSRRIVFGSNRNPQNEFNYRFLADPVGSDQYDEYRKKFGPDYQFRVFNDKGMPEYRDYIPGEVLPDGWSILPFFPGYEFKNGKSTYLGYEIGEGGRVYAEPGMYGNVWDGDITSQHPSSIIAEVLFGPRYTKAFKDILDGRVSIKHESWDEIDGLFDGKLRPYIEMVKAGELRSKDLANAIKTVINSVYGLTKAGFKNEFRDPRNKDNIVAKRGALFMTLLTQEVQKRGYVVAHNKTDSIKIPDATPEIQDFVIKFGKEYGYNFETEAVFEKFCLVNNAVYLAKTDKGEWTATGKQFAVPYVFKTLITHEPITFDDLCETFSVSKGALYLDMNETLPDVSGFEKELEKLETKYKQGKISDTTFERECSILNEKIAEGHEYRFVGRNGQFTPVKAGHGGGDLYCYNNDKYDSAAGAKGYRWLESEMIRDNMDIVDRSYYNKLVDDAIDTISQFGDFSWFVSDDPYIPKEKPYAFVNIPADITEEAVPWD